MAPVIKRSVSTLTRQASRVINKAIRKESDIAKLEIPATLLRVLGKFYLKDKYYCTETLPPLEPEEMTCWFEQPYEMLSSDEWLTLQAWSYGVPHFAYERNHIKLQWYTIDNGPDRLCPRCVEYLTKDHAVHYDVTRYADCDFVRGDELIDYLQCTNYWCNHCYTTALFFIEDWPWTSDHIASYLPARGRTYRI